MPLSLDVASMVCFAFASGMVFVLHAVESPAYALLTGRRKNIPESTETKLLLTHTKNVLGQFLAVRVPQIKAGLLVVGTACSAVLVYWSGDFISLRGLLVLCGIFFVPIMAKKALPAAQRVAAVSPSATTTELGAALRPLLKANRVGSLATVSFRLRARLCYLPCFVRVVRFGVVGLSRRARASPGLSWITSRSSLGPRFLGFFGLALGMIPMMRVPLAYSVVEFGRPLV